MNCERCGRKIPDERLKEVPGTRLCVACKNRIEKGAPDDQYEPALQLNVGSYSFQSWVLEDPETADAFIRLGIVVRDAPINAVSIVLTASEARKLARLLAESLEIIDEDLDDDSEDHED